MGYLILKHASRLDAFSVYHDRTRLPSYAVDDIRFYQKRAIVDVIQNQPVCDDVASAASVKLKLRAVYESLQSRAFVMIAQITI